jgi:hypothetical protein
MGVDFNRISFGISSGTSRTGFGTIVSNPNGGGHEPGDYAFTVYGATYPIAEGGELVEVTQLSGNTYPSQICDVDYIYEEGGGTVPDWSTVSNIQYRPNGFYHAGDGTPTSQTPVEVPFESGFYYDSEYITEYAALADGYGGYTWTSYGVDYWESATLITTDIENYLYYFWDGDGGYYSAYFGE